jgi:bacterioferritin
MDQAKVIDKLNEILRWEWTGVRQYSQHAFILCGPWREVYADMFLDNAEESFKHAKIIGDKISALGGVPTVEGVNVKQSDDLMEMLRYGYEFESGAVKLYGEAIELADDDHALRALLEDIIIEEQEGVDHFTKLLREQKSGGASLGASEKAG